MKGIIWNVCLCIVLGIVVPRVHAEESLLFDSTDHYLGGCQLTDKATWTIDTDMDVSIFQVWYNWNSGESELPVTLSKDGVVIASFTATRNSCDPYQKQWCNADFLLNTLLAKGTYETVIPNKRMCLKPGGTGTIRLYKRQSESVQPTATSTLQPAVPKQEVPITVQKETCTCDTNKSIGIAAGTAGVVSLIVSILIRKKM